MNNKILTVCIISLTLIVFTSGCFENENKKTNINTTNGSTGKTVTMNAREFENESIEDYNYDTNDFVFKLKSVDDGDTIIIHDNISEIIYNSDDDTTTVTFLWVNNSGWINSSDFTFYGNITGLYQADDEIKITLKIKHINLTFEYNGINVHYDFELPEEKWPGEDTFKANLKINPLPQSSIEKV